MKLLIFGAEHWSDSVYGPVMALLENPAFRATDVTFQGLESYLLIVREIGQFN